MSPLREPREYELLRPMRFLLLVISMFLSAVAIYLSRGSIERAILRAEGNEALNTVLATTLAVLVAGAIGWTVGAAIDRKTSRRARIVMSRLNQAALLVMSVVGVAWCIHWLRVLPGVHWGLVILAAMLAFVGLDQLKPVDSLLSGVRKRR